VKTLSLADSLLAPSHKRQKSQALSEFQLNPDVCEEKPLHLQPEASPTERRPDIVKVGEDNFRGIGWEVLRVAVENFAAQVI